MITMVQQEVARRLAEAQGYRNIRFHDNGLMTGWIDGRHVEIVHVDAPLFEMDFGRYVIVDDYGYESSGYHSDEEAENEAANLSEFRCRDYKVIDRLK